jgi:hypothetical protein
VAAATISGRRHELTYLSRAVAVGHWGDGTPNCSEVYVMESENAANVIKHHFGGGTRNAARRLRNLLSLDALHEANVRANPLPYLERTSERIFQLEKTLFEAAQAAKPQFGELPSAETIEISKAEYQRLLNCLSIVERSLNELGLADDLLATESDCS